MTYTDVITTLGAAHREYAKVNLTATEAHAKWESLADSMADFDDAEAEAKAKALDYVEAKADYDVARRVVDAARDEVNRSYLVLLRAGVPTFD